MGLSLFLVMLVMLFLSRLILRRGNYATITGKGFRPRALDVGRLRWPLVAVCWAYVGLSVFLPLGALLLTSFQRFATVILSQTACCSASSSPPSPCRWSASWCGSSIAATCRAAG